MRLTQFCLAIAAVAVAVSVAPAHADDTGDVVTRLGEAASCKDKDSPWRTWCPATSWAKGKTGALKPGIYAGVTVALPAGADVKQALSDRVTLVVLAVRREGKKLLVALRDIKPENDQESAMVAKAIMGVSAVLEGKAKEVTLEPDLRGFADSLPGRTTTTAPSSVRSGPRGS